MISKEAHIAAMEAMPVPQSEAAYAYQLWKYIEQAFPDRMTPPLWITDARHRLMRIERQRRREAVQRTYFLDCTEAV